MKIKLHWTFGENKPKQSQSQAKDGLVLPPVGRVTSVIGPQFFVLQLRRQLIDRIKSLYKPANYQYYNQRECRCSSTVEHSFRKAGVEGSNPSIGLSSNNIYRLGTNILRRIGKFYFFLGGLCVLCGLTWNYRNFIFATESTETSEVIFFLFFISVLLCCLDSYIFVGHSQR